MEPQENNNSKPANPAFRVIRSPQRPQDKTGSLINNLLVTIGTHFPQGVVSAVGGPVMAGLLAVMTCMTVVAVPTAFILGKAAGGSSMLGGKKGAGSAMSFAKLFGPMDSSMTEQMLDAEGIRAMNLEQEGPHPDEATTLGMVIPEKAPGANDAKNKQEAVRVSTYGNKKLDGSKSKFQNRFGSGSASGGGAFAVAGPGGKFEQTRIGPQIGLGGGAPASLPGISGSKGKSGKFGATKVGSYIKADGGAASQLAMAASLTQRPPAVDQIAAGRANAAFGEAAGSPAIIHGGPSGMVDSAGTGASEGYPSITGLKTGKSSIKVEVPSHDSEKNRGGGKRTKAWMAALAALAAAALLAFVVIPAIGGFSAGIERGIASTALALIGVAALGWAGSKLSEADVPAWQIAIFSGLAFVATSMMISAVATGKALGFLEGGKEDTMTKVDTPDNVRAEQQQIRQQQQQRLPILQDGGDPISYG